MKKTRTLLAIMPLFIFLFAGLPAKTIHAAEDVNIEKAIADGDHKTLAEYYKAEAEKYRKKAASHDTMAEDYRKSYVHYKGMENSMPFHCSKLKEKALEMAKQYDEMAKAEEKLIAK